MSYSLEEKVKHFAILSRLGVIVLQFVANLIVPEHDAGVFQKPLDANVTKTQLDIFVEGALRGLTRWDAQYFLHIAEYGYTYENTLAFFPLYPLIIRQLSYLALFVINNVLGAFLPVKDVISTHSTLILVGVLFNNLIFVRTSTVLYRLGLAALKSEKLAYVSAILFCMNPASIFFSACYSESLYCYLTFYGLLKIEEKNGLVNYIIMGTTGAVRSNGVVNLGFLVYRYIKLKCTAKLPAFYDVIFNFEISLSVLPFLTYQLYCYAKFCFPSKATLPEFIYDHGKSKDFVFPGGDSPWCNHFIPFAYSYVQKHYWNVGFLNYYEIKQIPNFLLAAPMIYVVVRGAWSFAKRHKVLLLYLGFVNGDSGNELPVSTFPYVVHGLALTLFAVFVMHIQVATRLLASSSPVPYWFCARVIAESVKNPVKVDVLQKLRKKQECFYESGDDGQSTWRSFLFSESLSGYSFFIKWYFFIYFVVGSLMFSNNLPWT